MTAPLVELDNVDVRLGGQPVLHGLSWRLLPGQRWLVLGGNGSGKSTLLRLLAGKLWPAPGQHARRRYGFGQEVSWSPLAAKGRMALLDPAMQNRYLRQDWNLAAGEVVATGFHDSDLVQQTPTAKQYAELRHVVALLGLEPIYARPFLDLSQGERRKVLLARALVLRPEVLLLDEFSEGLDAAARASLWRILDDLHARGLAIVLTSHRADLEGALAEWPSFWLEGGRITSPPEKRSTASGLDLPGEAQAGQQSPLVRACGDFFAGDKLLARGLDWTILPGQHWFLAGPNGSGKTSLLRLLWGEMHLAVGGMVEHFGQRCTTPEIRRQTGFFQPDFHGWVEPTDTVREVILSGCFSTIGLIDPVRASHEELANKAAYHWRIAELAERPFGDLSYGQQRRVLLARATVRHPRLLLLDEPFDGLDTAAVLLARDCLAKIAHAGTTIILTSHYESDVPSWVRHRAELDEARLLC